MGNGRQIAREASHVSWQRVMIMAVAGTLANVVLDHFGVIDWLIDAIPGGRW